ncbi:hypothetical protein SAMN05421789_10228 [Kaistella chaponensis]|uniref:Uncharacterized protein n=1 Tax=Kaistella chaponensis TaxID=713588 RepID=A0A1N7JGW7_9FLAO|nr:hypothetical protein [Kaistella chaponensis]SIS48504.1 hypothetical protein SAMN05421789_10228 [Kaistella chaponensis]
MKKFFFVLTIITLVSCKKDKEIISDNIVVDSTKSVTDSLQRPELRNPDKSVAFQILPQNIASEKGRTIFKQNGNVLFYFDQNSNEGNIRIDGKDYTLSQFDFTENNYSISGNGVEIEAANGDFKDEKNECMEGDFPEIKVSLDGKIVNLANITSEDCSNY